MPPQIRLELAPSPAALAKAARTRSLSLANISTLADVLVLLASWSYDLNYAPSLQMALDRNLPGRLRQELPDTPEVQALLAGWERS